MCRPRWVAGCYVHGCSPSRGTDPVSKTDASCITWFGVSRLFDSPHHDDPDFKGMTSRQRALLSFNYSTALFNCSKRHPTAVLSKESSSRGRLRYQLWHMCEKHAFGHHWWTAVYTEMWGIWIWTTEYEPETCFRYDTTSSIMSTTPQHFFH